MTLDDLARVIWDGDIATSKTGRLPGEESWEGIAPNVRRHMTDIARAVVLALADDIDNVNSDLLYLRMQLLVAEARQEPDR